MFVDFLIPFCFGFPFPPGDLDHPQNAPSHLLSLAFELRRIRRRRDDDPIKIFRGIRRVGHEGPAPTRRARGPWPCAAV